VGLIASMVPSVVVADGGRRVVRHTMRGVVHELVLPAGWDGKGEGDGFVFVAPTARIKQAPYTVGLVTVERPAGFTATATQVAQYLATEEKKTSHPTWETTEPDDMQFVGQPGAIMMLGGMDDAKVARAIVYVVSLAPKEFYYLRAEGSIEDTQAMFEDLGAIISGVTRLDTATKAAPPRSG
jgi:hypothetical protein